MKKAIKDSVLIKWALAYSENIGFEESVKFYQKANNEQIKLYEQLLDNEKYLEAWALLKEVLDVDLYDF